MVLLLGQRVVTTMSSCHHVSLVVSQLKRLVFPKQLVVRWLLVLVLLLLVVVVAAAAATRDNNRKTRLVVV